MIILYLWGRSTIVWKEGDISYNILLQLYSTGDSSLW
ncbi:hypothetical protein Q428_12480 [Fervidicella metallireducens AeB]|uniref:Uncharacterized protein n=1 Tax=Fervidicella metallireducens AeB TaxID=1403537 RepID=A0A017RUN4_9CLOT|nr:hypothetical protein Q428_12480 [Fervidicella metallireducens AeB]